MKVNKEPDFPTQNNDDPQILILAHSNQCDPAMSIQIKARYNGKNFLPLENVDLPTDTDVILEIKTDPVTRLRGLVRLENKQWIDQIINDPSLESY